MVHFRSKLLLSGAMLLAGFIAPPLAGVGAASAQEATSTSAAAADPASTGEVTIYRDKMGVPHVFADTAPALFYGASYAIAHDRLAEAEIDARAILGRMSEIAGPGSVPADKYARTTLATDASVKQQFERLTPEYQAIFRAMHEGWNARVREVRNDPAELPYEFKEWGIQPTEWSLWEFLRTMGGVVRYYGTGGGGKELTNLAFYKDLLSKYPEAEAKRIFDDVLPLQDPDAVPFIPAADLSLHEVKAPMLSAQQSAQPLSSSPPVSDRPVGGASRALLIGAKRSASGNPIILHATADGPDLHLSGAGFDAAGYVFSTMSPVIQGRTPTFAWSVTTGEADNVDIFAEKLNPANPRQYFYKGQWKDMEIRAEVIQVKGGDPVRFEIESTVHGPIVHREDAANVAYSVKNAMAGNEIIALSGPLELNRAKTFEDYKAAAAKFGGSINVNYAGSDKRIATMRVGLQPIRPQGLDPRLPTPGTGEFEWQGYVTSFPFVVDPAQGYLHIWNNKATADASYGDTSRYGKSFRTWLGRELAESKEKISRDDVHEFHRLIGRSSGGADLSLTNPKFFTPYLKRAVAGNSSLEAAVAAMEAWNAIYEDKDADGFYDSPGLTIYRKWYEIAQKSLIGDDIGDWWHKIDDDKYIKYRTDVLLRAIEGPDAGAPMNHDWFNGVAREVALRKTVTDTVKALQSEYGSDKPLTWRQRVFYRYYNQAARASNPDKPTRSAAWPSNAFGPVSLAAGRLGLQPDYISDNGSEGWNMLVEVKPGDPVLYDSTPSGGQNLFIDTAGKGNPNIADQVRLHETFEFKAVDLDRERIKQNAVSVQTLKVPGPLGK